VWIELGTLEPEFWDWRQFPALSLKGRYVRLSFAGSAGKPLQRLRSKILLRRKWIDPLHPVVDLARAVYPDNNAVVLAYPPDPNYPALGLTTAQWEIKLSYRYKDLGREEMVYSVLLEETEPGAPFSASGGAGSQGDGSSQNQLSNSFQL